MRRSLSRFRLFVCVPLGVLWIAVLAVMAVPVILVMTALYYLRVGAGALVPGRRHPRHGARNEA